MDNELKTQELTGTIIGRVNNIYYLLKIEDRYFLLDRGQRFLPLIFPSLGWKMKYTLNEIGQDTKEKIYDEGAHRSNIKSKNSLFGPGFASMIVVLIRPFINLFIVSTIINIILLLIGFIIILRITIYNRKNRNVIPSSAFLSKSEAICLPNNGRAGNVFMAFIAAILLILPLLVAIVSNNIIFVILSYLFFYLWTSSAGFLGNKGECKIWKYGI